jgi:hypothetical protein
MHELRDVLLATYPGFAKIYEDIRKLLCRPKMVKDIEKYIKSCHRCQVNKPYREVTSAPLKLMPIPQSLWESIPLDFVTTLPKNKGYNSILGVVCYLFKMTHFIPTDAVNVAELFIENTFKLHGFLKTIISDRDPKFTSKLWKSLFKTLETELRFSTAFHPETDGETERLNQAFEIILTHWVEHHLNTWTEYLQVLEFAYKSARHSGTEMSPFSLVHRRNSDSPISIAL